MSRTANYNKNTVIEIFDVDDTNIPKELIYSTTIPYTSLSVSKSSITIEITDITLENCKKYVVSFKQEND
ncbi:MAG: hypothetical protein LBG59_09025 [Candidatus Peribacteria bacterium]|jgi:hypothetical protein|nr:hypothetical protein [Candidatus Peribacteria bacterium]